MRRWPRRGVLLALAAALVVVGVLASGWVVVERDEPAWFARMRYPLEYDHIVAGHARNYDLDGALLAAVIYRESRFDPDAHSSSGAVGLMQLLPSTARGIARLTGGTRFVVRDLYDPEVNVRYGAFYLRRLLTRYEGRVDLALAAYNAGQANVDRWLARDEGIGFPETRDYVRDILHLRGVYRRAYGDRLPEA